jgi:hypothetical protein
VTISVISNRIYIYFAFFFANQGLIPQKNRTRWACWNLQKSNSNLRSYIKLLQLLRCFKRANIFDKLHIIVGVSSHEPPKFSLEKNDTVIIQKKMMINVFFYGFHFACELSVVSWFLFFGSQLRPRSPTESSGGKRKKHHFFPHKVAFSRLDSVGERGRNCDPKKRNQETTESSHAKWKP